MDKAMFLKELMEEHTEIRRLLRDLETAVTDSDSMDCRLVSSMLADLEGKLLDHVAREDRRFYPELRTGALEAGQTALLPALDLFINSMGKLSARAREFFDNYGSAVRIAADQEGFKKGFMGLKRDMLERIKSEEGSIYAIYRSYYS